MEIVVTTVDGTDLPLSAMRGAPVLLFLFATFDGVSQLMLDPLGALATERPALPIVAIAVQPSPRELVSAWAAALEPAMIVGWEADPAIAAGRSELGAIEHVPTIVVLDARGVERARAVGYVDLERMRGLVGPSGAE